MTSNERQPAPESVNTERDAETAGAQAFLEGNWTYPLYLDHDTNLFRAWCRGYMEAVRQHDAMYWEIA